MLSRRPPAHTAVTTPSDQVRRAIRTSTLKIKLGALSVRTARQLRDCDVRLERAQSLLEQFPGRPPFSERPRFGLPACVRGTRARSDSTLPQYAAVPDQLVRYAGRTQTLAVRRGLPPRCPCPWVTRAGEPVCAPGAWRPRRRNTRDLGPRRGPTVRPRPDRSERSPPTPAPSSDATSTSAAPHADGTHRRALQSRWLNLLVQQIAALHPLLVDPTRHRRRHRPTPATTPRISDSSSTGSKPPRRLVTHAPEAELAGRSIRLPD